MAKEELLYVQWYYPTDKHDGIMYGLPVSEKKLGQKKFECSEGAIFKSSKQLYLDIASGGFIVRSKNTREDGNFYVVIKSVNIAIPIDRNANLYLRNLWNRLYFNKPWNDHDECKGIILDIRSAYNKIPDERIVLGKKAVKQHFEECLRETIKQ